MHKCLACCARILFSKNHLCGDCVKRAKDVIVEFRETGKLKITENKLLNRLIQETLNNN